MFSPGVDNSINKISILNILMPDRSAEAQVASRAIIDPLTSMFGQPDRLFLIKALNLKTRYSAFYTRSLEPRIAAQKHFNACAVQCMACLPMISNGIEVDSLGIPCATQKDMHASFLHQSNRVLALLHTTSVLSSYSSTAVDRQFLCSFLVLHNVECSVPSTSRLHLPSGRRRSVG